MNYVSTENSPIREIIDILIGPIVIVGMAYPGVTHTLFSLFDTAGKIGTYANPYVLFDACGNGLNDSCKAIEQLNEDGVQFVLF